MENLEKIKLELELKKAKRDKIEAKMEAEKARYKQMDEITGRRPRTLFLYSIASGLGGGVVGFMGATAIRGTAVASYLGKAENLESTNEMMELTGTTTIEELKEFLLHDGGELGSYLYEACGARNYIGTISLELMSASAIVAGALIGIPAVYKYVKARRKENCYKEIMRCNSECESLNRECASLQSIIDNGVRADMDEDIAEHGASTKIATSEQMSR